MRALPDALPAAPLLALLALAPGCDDWSLKTNPAQPGVESEALDWSVDPCADFYRFACGNWKYWHGIAPDAAAESRIWIAQHDQTALLEQIVVDDAAWAGDDQRTRPDTETNDPYARLIGDHYNSCMSSAQQSTVSQALRPQRDAIDAITSLHDLPRTLARLQRDGVTPLLSAGTTPDAGDPTTQILWMGPGAQSMARTYYVDAQHESIRARYHQHIADLSRVAQDATGSDPAIDPDAVLRIETALATASATPEQERDPMATYHPLGADQLTQAVPLLDWKAYFTEVGIAPPARLDAPSPAYLRAVNDLLQTTPLADLKSYLRWRLLEASASALGWRAQPIEFAFHRTLFDGTVAAPPDWWRCYLATESNLDFALARPFIARLFGPPQRQAATAMIAAISAQMRERLGQSSWLDDQTRTAALDKLAAVQPQIGYPDQLPTYDLKLLPDDYLQNLILLHNRAWERSLAKLNHPVDRMSWGLSPIVTNAFYDPQRNIIAFPAAILQPPFFSVDRPAAANYGAIGSIMGHELSHAFDDQGRQYDGQGALRNWWTPSVARDFQQRATCLVDQYMSYQPLPATPINGTLTLGENLADLVGLQLAHAAFLADDGGGAGQAAPGFFAPEQQFFIAFAQNWCSNERPEYATQLLRADPHSPDRYRVNGAVSNLPAFAAAFHCPMAAPLSPVNRCQIW